MPKPIFIVREVFANGDQRCEVRWAPGAEPIDSPVVGDWRQVRDVNLVEIDPLTGESVFSFTRKNPGRVRRSA